MGSLPPQRQTPHNLRESPEQAADIVGIHNQLWVADLTYVAIPGGFV